MRNQTDEQLVRQYRKGNNQAAFFLVEKHRNYLLLVAYAKTKRMEDAKDILSDVVLDLICTPIEKREKKLSTNKKGSAILYLKTLIRNKAIDWYRKNYRITGLPEDRNKGRKMTIPELVEEYDFLIGLEYRDILDVIQTFLKNKGTS